MLANTIDLPYYCLASIGEFLKKFSCTQINQIPPLILMNRIALVNCYMGALPNCFQLFLNSATQNLDIDFYIFN